MGMVQETTPLVSVCIANFNGEQFIQECIETVKNQTCDAEIEIIIHDDCSTDQSAELISTLFPDVKLIQSETNVGFCVSNNRMALQAKGKYLLLLNNDAFLQKNALATLLFFSKKYGDAILTLPQYDATSKKLLDCGMYMDLFANPIPSHEIALKNIAMAMGSCLWINNELWLKVGGFPEWFQSIGEDMYLCSSARRMGYQVLSLPESGYYHHVGKSFGGGKLINNKVETTYKRRAYSERNKTFVILTTYPFLLLLFTIPLHFVSLSIECLILCLAKKSVEPFKKIYAPIPISLIQNSENIWGVRRRINSQKEERPNRNSGYTKPIRLLPHKVFMFIKHGIPKLQ